MSDSKKLRDLQLEGERNVVDEAIKKGLLFLRGCGRVDDALLASEDQKKEYVRVVCSRAASVLASMPAVQRAMDCAHPGLGRVECFKRVVVAVADAFGVDSGSILAEMQPGLAGSFCMPVNLDQN